MEIENFMITESEYLNALNIVKQYESQDDVSDINGEPILIGHLSRKYGIVGYEPAEIGHPVYRMNGKLVLTVKSLRDLPDYNLVFNEPTLKPHVDYLP